MEKSTLNFGWLYTPRFEERFLTEDGGALDFERVDLPHTNKVLPFNNFSETEYQFVCTYQRRLARTADDLKKRQILRFDGAAVFAEVFVNGVPVGSHKGAYTSFDVDITDALTAGDNLVTVKLDCTERDEIPPFGNVADYLVYGGLYREVWLLEAETPVYITNVKITPLTVLTSPKAEVLVVLSEAADAEYSVIVQNTEYKMQSGGVTSSITIDMAGCTLWDTDNPAMYGVTVSLSIKGKVVDTYTARFGMREAVFKRDGFYLNGKKIKLRGLNRHQSYPYVGYAMPKSVQEADAVLLKKHLGVNLVRTSHYPQSRHFLNKCDELGLLVFTEIPGWQHISEDEEWRALTLKNVEDMISQNFNHPSVILWGIRINESGRDNALYKKTNALAKSLDKSRQTGGVRVIPFLERFEDVYNINDFSLGSGKRALMKPFMNGGAFKPYLVTENNGHMYPVKAFDDEGQRIELALRHARVISACRKSKRISGTIGWCMADYNTHKDFGSGDRICYHGVTDMFRNDKTAAWTFISQQDETPFVALSSNMEIGDYPGGNIGAVYAFTNCEQLKFYKNGDYLVTYDVKKYAKKDRRFKHMVHPPVVLDDFVGNLLVEKDGFSKSKARLYKSVIKATVTKGIMGGIISRLPSLAALMLFYGQGVGKLYDTIRRYITSWGSKEVTYTLEGVIGGKVVASTTRGSQNGAVLAAAADADTLTIADTYDAVRVAVFAKDQNGNVLPYDSSVINVDVTDNIEVMGGRQFALRGGQGAFWVKSKAAGEAKIVIKSEIGEKEVRLWVK